MASLLWFVGRPQVEAGAASGLRPQGRGLPIPHLLSAPRASLAFLTCTQGLSDLPSLALLGGMGAPDIYPLAVGPQLHSRKGLKPKAFCSRLPCHIHLIEWVTEPGDTHRHTDF